MPEAVPIHRCLLETAPMRAFATNRVADLQSKNVRQTGPNAPMTHCVVEFSLDEPGRLPQTSYLPNSQAFHGVNRGSERHEHLREAQVEH